MTGTMNLKELLTSNLRQSGIFVAFAAIVALFFSVLHPNFLSRATSPTSSCSTPTSSSWPSA